MNKAELIETMSRKVPGVSKKAVGDLVDAFTDTVQANLKKGAKVTLVGFGTFSTGKRSPRAGRNPRTGETIKIPASKTVKFSAGAGLKKAVNKK
ncbi:MAG TPA: HU family DNA-binding protein [Burkholderiales bacterium]|nr:HU family DNA-binding protein [Burkholderiales bacterium]